MARTVTIIDNFDLEGHYKVGDTLPDLTGGIKLVGLVPDDMEYRGDGVLYCGYKGHMLNWMLNYQDCFNIVDDETGILLFTSRDYCDSLGYSMDRPEGRCKVGDVIPQYRESEVARLDICPEDIRLQRSEKRLEYRHDDVYFGWALTCQDDFNIVDDDTGTLLFTSRDYCVSLLGGDRRDRNYARFWHALEQFIAQGCPLPENPTYVEDDEWVEI